MVTGQDADGFRIATGTMLPHMAMNVMTSEIRHLITIAVIHNSQPEISS